MDQVKRDWKNVYYVMKTSNIAILGSEGTGHSLLDLLDIWATG